MPQATSVPYLETEALIAAWKVLDQRDASHPLLSVFPRRGQPSPKIKVRTITRKAGQVRHTTWGGRAVPVSRGQIKELMYEPAVIKLFENLGIEDMNLYTEAARASGANDVGDFGRAMIASADQRTMDLAMDLRSDDVEEVHRLMIGALLGSVAYRLEGTGDITIDYGLTEIDSPGTLWDNIGATIATDIQIAINTFRDANASGLSPNTVFYNPKVTAEYFIGNTELKELKKAHPDFAIGLFGMPGGRRDSDNEGRVADFFGLNWVPIEGTYRDLDGVVQDRWPVNKLVLARLGSDGAMPEFSMALSQWHTPRAEPEIEVTGPQPGSDVKTGKVLLFDNGVPTFRQPDMVMPWTIGAEPG